jgi:hypothetical protein
MPIHVRVTPFPNLPPTILQAADDGSIPLPPGHLYECYDWTPDHPSTQELQSIPPESWLGTVLRAMYPGDEALSPRAERLRSNHDTDAPAAADVHAPAAAADASLPRIRFAAAGRAGR